MSAELTDSILREYGCYYYRGPHAKVSGKRAEKLQLFITELGCDPEWITDNVSIVTCRNARNPPEAFRGRPSKRIGEADHNHLWAVLPPLETEQEFLEDFLDEFDCCVSGFEHSDEAEQHVIRTRERLSERLTLIKGEG